MPVIADADNGYGNAINVIRTVKEYIQTGVAAIHIEDQIIPKRCGHVAGRQVIPIEEAAGKYAAADYARKEVDEDFVVIARTDARGAVGGSLDEAIKRANAYLEAGADVAFVEGPKDIEEVRRVCAEVNGPIMYNQTGISPRFSEEEMNELGIAMTILPGATMRMQLMAVYDLAMELKEKAQWPKRSSPRNCQTTRLPTSMASPDSTKSWSGKSASWARRNSRNTKARLATSRKRPSEPPDRALRSSVSAVNAETTTVAVSRTAFCISDSTVFSLVCCRVSTQRRCDSG